MNIRHLLAKLDTLTINEEVSPDDIEGLLQQLKSGEIDYDEFRSKLDSFEQTDYSMRQGEMGNPNARDDMQYNRPGGDREEWDQYDREEWDQYDREEDEYEYEESRVAESVQVKECPMEDEAGMDAPTSDKPTMNVTMNASSADSIRQLLDVLSNFEAGVPGDTDPGMLKAPIPMDGEDDPLDGDEAEGIVGRGVGGVAGDVLGTAVGANVGDKVTGEDTADIDEFVNRPDEKYAPVSAVTASGNDMHRSKTSYSDKAYRGDNPMESLKLRLESLYNELKSK